MVSPLLKLPPLDPLRGFVAAARHLSFTRAADELCLTQSAISRQVQTLEEALQVKLFERGVRSLSLTEAGVRLAEAADGWLQEYGRLAERLRPEERTVTITASIGMAALWLVPRLPGFQDAHPDVDVRIAATNRLADLTREGLDLALRYCADRDVPAGGLRLFGETVFPVARPDVAHGLVLDAATVPRLTLLEYDNTGFPWISWAHWLAALGLADIKPRARLHLSHYDQLIHAAMAGQGIAIGRGPLVTALINEGRLAVVGERREAIEGRGFWLVPAPGPMRPEAAALADWVCATAAAEEAGLAGMSA